jgi:hypothetical protein
MLFVGWLASRLQWETGPLEADGGASLIGDALDAHRNNVALRLEAAPQLQVRGLEGLTLRTALGHQRSLDRGPGGLHAHDRNSQGHERAWTIPGASRGETGILGEGIRQALLRDPTYVPALKAARCLLA